MPRATRRGRHSAASADGAQAYANLVGEFNALSMTTLAPGATLPLGNAYVGDGSGTRDLEFQFLQFGAGQPAVQIGTAQSQRAGRIETEILLQPLAIAQQIGAQ